MPCCCVEFYVSHLLCPRQHPYAVLGAGVQQHHFRICHFPEQVCICSVCLRSFGFAFPNVTAFLNVMCLCTELCWRHGFDLPFTALSVPAWHPWSRLHGHGQFALTAAQHAVTLHY
jgi:hypothetical protein